MKKALIAIISAIYVFAIIIVSFLGVRAEISNRTVYAEQILLLNQNVINPNTSEIAIEVYKRPDESLINDEGRGIEDNIVWNYGDGLQEHRNYVIKIRDTNFLFDVMGKKYKLETKVLPEDTTRKDLNFFISASEGIKATLKVNNVGDISFLEEYNSAVSLDMIISTTDLSNVSIDVYMLIARYK